MRKRLPNADARAPILSARGRLRLHLRRAPHARRSRGGWARAAGSRFRCRGAGTSRPASISKNASPAAPIDRVTAGASMSRRHNLAFDQDDDRARLSVRGEREFTRGCASAPAAAGSARRSRASPISSRRPAATSCSTRASIRSWRATRSTPVPRGSTCIRQRSAVEPATPGGYTGYQGSANRTELDGARLPRARRPDRAGGCVSAGRLGSAAAALPAAAARRPEHAARLPRRQLRRRHAGRDVRGGRPAADLAGQASASSASARSSIAAPSTTRASASAIRR